MNLQRWIARKELSWKQLERLLRKAETRGLRSLSAEEVQGLSSLYRSVSADFARAQTTQVSQTLIQTLQSLTSRAYSQIYQGTRRQEWKSVLAFYQWELPAVIRSTLPYTLLATALFGVGVLVAWWFTWQDPSFMSLVVPSHIIEQVRDRGELWMGNIVGVEPLASSGIMVNNLIVSFRAVAGGITGGLFTTWVMLLNGVMIGAIATLVGQNNLAYPFWAFVFPHGSLELPAIFLAGGAGFLIARALLFPGRYRRIEALKIYGLQAVKLVYGVIPMLVLAGTIEGFFSPSPIVPEIVKYTVGILLFVGLIAYCQRRPA